MKPSNKNPSRTPPSLPDKRSHANVATPQKDIRLFLLIAYLLSLVLEGPVRFALMLAHVETLLYLRDAAALFIVVTTIARPRTYETPGLNITAIASYIIICHSALGFWLGHPVFSTLFAIKIFLSLLFGTACSKYINTQSGLITKFLTFTFIISAIGVYINLAAGMLPWEGTEFESAFGSVNNSRVWWAGGERRLPGFARMSYSAAAIIGLSGVFLASLTRNYLLKVAIIGVGLPAIYITTSKGVILSFVLTGAWCFIPAGRIRRTTGVWLLWSCSLAAIALPLICAYIQPDPTLMRKVPGVFTSFTERATLTWPNAIADYTNWFNWFLGQGVGGIGGALRYGSEYYRFNPIDNLFLYFFTTFGLLGAAYYLFCTHQIARFARQESDYHTALLAMGILFFSYGITAHQLEDAFESILFGLLIAAPAVQFQEYQRRKSIAQKNIQEVQSIWEHR